MHWFGRVLGVTLIVAALLSVGAFAFQLGAASVAGQAIAAGGGTVAPMMGYGWGWHPFGFWHFNPFGFIFPLLFVFLLFGLLRRAMWGGGHRHGWQGGPWMGGPMASGRMNHLRQLHEELHRQQAAKPEAPQTPPAQQ